MVQFLFAGWLVFQISGTLSKSNCSVIKILLTNGDPAPLWQMVQVLFVGWLVFKVFGTLSNLYCSVIKTLLTNNDSEPL